MPEKPFTNDPFLPVDLVFAPAWWHHENGITFDREFFFHPDRRVEVERRMEQILYERWGKYGLGLDREKSLPQVGAVHLAAGFLLSEMLGCQVEYLEQAPPQVIPAAVELSSISADEAFDSQAWKSFERLVETLETRHGYVTGDVNWGGVLNLALDLRGQELFLDLFDRPEQVRAFFDEIARVIERFTGYIRKKTGTTSISVNRTVRHLEPALFLHSECALTMISDVHYEEFLSGYDVKWSKEHRPFGIHFCGTDPHRYGAAFARLPHLDFLDVGWGGDVAALRKHLPHSFLNLRLSPVDIIDSSVDAVEADIRRLVAESGDPRLTGVCCINMDEKVSDEKITAMFETVAALRKEYQ